MFTISARQGETPSPAIARTQPAARTLYAASRADKTLNRIAGSIAFTSFGTFL